MKSFWIEWAVRGLVLVALGGGLYVLHIRTIAAQNVYQAKFDELEQAPQRILESAGQASDLARREFDISRIQRLLVRRDEIVEVVGAIEAEASRYNLQVSVPEIIEPEETSQVIQEIELRVSADGNAEHIVDFAHSIEHLPYLVNVKAWSLSTRSFALPQSAAQAPDNQTKEVVSTAGHGELTLVIVVQNPDYENLK